MLRKNCKKRIQQIAVAKSKKYLVLTSFFRQNSSIKTAMRKSKLIRNSNIKSKKIIKNNLKNRSILLKKLIIHIHNILKWPINHLLVLRLRISLLLNKLKPLTQIVKLK
jgi:hypothetical protein